MALITVDNIVNLIEGNLLYYFPNSNADSSQVKIFYLNKITGKYNTSLEEREDVYVMDENTEFEILAVIPAYFPELPSVSTTLRFTKKYNELVNGDWYTANQSEKREFNFL